MRCILLKKRRFRIALAVLVTVVVFSVLAVANSRLLNNFKIYAQKKIAADFNIEVEIGEITGGFVRPLTFKNIRILRSKKGQPFSFQANALSPTCRIWDLLLAQAFGYEELVFILSEGNLYLNSQEPVFSQIKGRIAVDKTGTTQINLIAHHDADRLSLAGVIKRRSPYELDLKLTYAKDFAKADLTLSGPLKELELEGSVFLLEEKKVDFKSILAVSGGRIEFKNANFNRSYSAEGLYDFENSKFNAKIFRAGAEEKTLTVDFNLDDEVCLRNTNIKPFLLKLNFNHFNILEQDVVSLLEFKGGLLDSGPHKRRLAFELLTCGTIVGHRPTSELEILCNFEDWVLDITSARWGSGHFASGTIDFGKHPPQADLVWQFEGLDLSDLLVLSNKSNTGQEPYLAGELAGKVCIEKDLFNPFNKLSIDSKKGVFLGIKFESANVNLDGNYPVLTLHDSRIYRKEGGFFILDGKIDLRNIKTAMLLEDVRVLSDEKTIFLDGWDISRGAGQSEFNLKKAVSEDLKVGFKTFINDPMQNLGKESDALELEYKLQGNRSFLMRIEKDGEFFGLKQEAKF